MATPAHHHHKLDKSNFFLKSQQQIYHNDSDDGDDEFYHVKQCYQSVPKTKPSRRTTAATNVRQHHNLTSTDLPSSLLLLHTHTRSSFCGVGSLLLCRRQHWLIVVACMLLLHATTMSTLAAPQSCILCDKNDLIAKDPHTNYEEFLFEHQVTRHDAINALKQLNESFYEGKQDDSSCNGVRCTDKVNKYCLGPQFINDHCWCEFGHSTEGLPFVPHICYVGEKIYKPSVGSCFFYEEVKECCCSSLLAQEWRHISSSSSLHRNSTVAVLITFLYLLIRRMHF